MTLSSRVWSSGAREERLDTKPKLIAVGHRTIVSLQIETSRSLSSPTTTSMPRAFRKQPVPTDDGQLKGGVVVAAGARDHHAASRKA